MKRSCTCSITLLVALTLSGCGNGDVPPEGAPVATDSAEGSPVVPAEAAALSPEQTLARLLELARAGDWETYVDDFYGESHKFEGIPERRDAVIARFRDKWAETVIEGFEALGEGGAVLSEDGKRAVFMLDGEPNFNLFLSDEGHWTFHL